MYTMEYTAVLAQEPFSSDGDQEEAKKRWTRGAFPRLSFSKTLELPQAVFELGEGERVRRLYVFNHLRKSPDSGPSRTLISAANSGYGIVTGSYKSEYLELTELGIKIFNSNKKFNKYQAIYEALFANEIFSSFTSRFCGKGIPNDEFAIDYLTAKHELQEVDAKVCWQVIKENLIDFDLSQELSDRIILISPEMALEKILESLPEEYTETLLKESPDVKTPLPQAAIKSSLSSSSDLKAGKFDPQFHFNIQIHLPENASPEAYDAIFKSIGTHLLGRNEE